MALAAAGVLSPPTNYGVALYPGYQALDVFGPLDVLNNLSRDTPLELSIIAATLDPVNTVVEGPGHIGESIVPTHTFDNFPDDLDVLLVPGGYGNRNLTTMNSVADFVKGVYPRLRYLLTVCTGSAVVASSGLLDGKNATTNKMSWDWATSQGPEVNWVRHARWVVDGNIWTSSGVSAGIDLTFAFVADQYGEETSKKLANLAEYVRNTDPNNDPFA
ncbi:class I glutamine amidotransferase-like protein [Poronia punctata]|nr:class I glutamine amidotransferase-like protein [Poronia punctata]